MMQIAYIAAGAGNLYCGACASDIALNRALRRAGVATLMLPLYTPLRGGDDIVYPRVFLGGVSTWLRNKPAPLSWIAALLTPLLDSPAVLRAVSGFALKTDPHDLGALTVSVLRGQQGPHARQLQAIVSWLRRAAHPQAVHLSNSLLSPLAQPLREQLGCPVICTIQGEEHFIAGLPGRYGAQAIALLREHMKHVDQVVRPTSADAAAVGALLGRDPAGFTVIPPAVEMPGGAFAPRSRAEVTLGYLSAIRPEKGLDLLVKAMTDLVPRTPAPVQVRIAGQVADARYWRQQESLLPDLVPAFHSVFQGELTPEQKDRMLHECHLFVMPSRIPEVRGLAALEAMAAGCAVVAPRHGIFTELLVSTPELLFEPDDVRSLSETILRLLRNRAELEAAGSACAQAARGYAPEVAAGKLTALYERCGASAAGTSGAAGARSTSSS